MKGSMKVSRTNEHKTVFFNLLSKYCPSVFLQLAPPDVGFPRTVYEFKQLSVEGFSYEKYILTLNCYDKAQAETMDEAVDALIENIDKSIYYTDKVYYQFFYNKDRQPIAEADKTLKRIMLTFEVRVYVRSE